MTKWTVRIFLLLAIIISLGILRVDETNAQGPTPGAIWTTSGGCGDEQQNVNQYETGETVWINGRGFIPGTYPWSIQGQPGGASGDPNIIVASGNVTTNAFGAFCFPAYTIPADDWGTYNVNVCVKSDNYRVSQQPTPTDPTPTDPTPTDPTPTDPTPTDPTPTDPTPTDPTPTDPTPTDPTPTDPTPTDPTPTDPTPTDPTPTDPTPTYPTPIITQTPVPVTPPATGGPFDPSLFLYATIAFGLISLSSLFLWKKRVE